MTRKLQRLAKVFAALCGCAFAASGCQSRTLGVGVRNPNILCRYEKGSIDIPGIGTLTFPAGADHYFHWREADSVVLSEHEFKEGEIEQLPATENNDIIEFEQGYPSRHYSINLANGNLTKVIDIQNKTIKGVSVLIQGQCRRL